MSTYRSLIEDLARECLSARATRALEFAEKLFKIKKLIVTAPTQSLFSIAEYLKVTGEITPKTLFNAFLIQAFPNLTTTTTESQSHLIASVEEKILKHFAKHPVVAASTGSYSILGKAQSKFSDYDCFLVPNSSSVDIVPILNGLIDCGITVYAGDGVGSTDEALSVIDNGNQGYGLVQAVSTEGVLVDFFVIGKNSLAELANRNGAVKKLKPSETVVLPQPSMTYPHRKVMVEIVSRLDPYIKSWPLIINESPACNRVIGFLSSALVYTSSLKMSAENGYFTDCRRATFNTTRELLIEQNPERYSPDSWSENSLQQLLYCGGK